MCTRPGYRSAIAIQLTYLLYMHLSKTKLPFFISRRTYFRPGFSHSRAQDVSTNVRNVLSRQISWKLASAANPGQTNFFSRISTPDPSWLPRANPGVPDGDSGTI